MAKISKTIFLIACLTLFCGAGCHLGNYYFQAWKAQSQFSELKKVVQEDVQTSKYAGLCQKNNDIVGWIKVDGTKIDYPVMQTKDDPEYYLHRDFQRQHSESGTPFMDAESDVSTPTCNLMIYGHNMKSGIMFHDLVKYEDSKFYQKHPTFSFDTIYKGGQGTYQIIAAGYSKIYAEDSDAFKYYQYAGITTEEDFNEYVDGVRSISAYDTGQSAEFGDQLVTLSTCAYQTKEGRFFVVGKRINTN